MAVTEYIRTIDDTDPNRLLINPQQSLTEAPCYGVIAATWTGIWASDQPAQIKWSCLGERVLLTFEPCAAVANTVAYISLVGTLPSNLWPEWNHSESMRVTNNGTGAGGNILVTSAGAVLIYADQDNGNFAGTGSSGFYSDSAFYLK